METRLLTIFTFHESPKLSHSWKPPSNTLVSKCAIKISSKRNCQLVSFFNLWSGAVFSFYCHAGHICCGIYCSANEHSRLHKLHNEDSWNSWLINQNMFQFEWFTHSNPVNRIVAACCSFISSGVFTCCSVRLLLVPLCSRVKTRGVSGAAPL